MTSALGVDGRLLSDEERAEIERAMSRLAAAVAEGDQRAIRERTSELDLQTKPFAERRMNEGINRAIGGHQVDEIGEKVEHAKGTAEHEGLGGGG